MTKQTTTKAVVASIGVTPYCIESECALLRALLHNGNLWTDIRNELRPEDFYTEEHQKFYHWLADQLERGEHASLDVLKKLLAADSDKDKQMTLSKLEAFASETIPTTDIRRLARTLHKRYFLRQMLKVQEELGLSLNAS